MSPGAAGGRRRGAAGHVARKRFGQHFLVDGGVVDAIVDAVDPRPGQALVEIGPGLGALTRMLLARCGALTAIELDRDLAARLRGWPGLTVIEADVLTVDFGTLADAAGQRLRIVGNLPYNISSPILFHLMHWAGRVHDQHVMLQKEVCERIAAAPGGRDYGRLSVMLQWRYAIEPVLDVPPTAFDPPPRVDSAVVCMRPRPDPAPVDPALLSELVQVAFSQRRKLLRHTLGRWLQAREAADAAGAMAGFDLQRRAEEVPVAEYLALAARLPARPPPCAA
ncbi:MAG: 16S rRNA (adenine(1518)-N(6)/adenine(1519)-N(6))-dimethyltransferase RsmA [Burkholderiales bacterium]|nr:16S rRNA (adenine(1518)-N(6)/adenine(1519)-N(6))-dimethyltransferase RsmA [Burkholderiales bacterium]